jgi:hypothetical protein
LANRNIFGGHPDGGLYMRDAVHFFAINKKDDRFQREIYFHIEEVKGIPGYKDGAYRINSTVYALRVGSDMEKINEELKEVNEQVAESKKILKEMSNEVSAMAAVIQPKIENHIKEIRAMRMTLLQELSQSLNALREVRKFFLESDYQIERDRLRDFIAMCKELQILKDTGVLDAVCDSAVRLALKEESK